MRKYSAHTRAFETSHSRCRWLARKYHQSVFLDSTAKLTPIKASAEKISKSDWKSNAKVGRNRLVAPKIN
jgi:hypothetical protein